MELDIQKHSTVYAEGFSKGLSEATIDHLVEEYQEEYLEDPLTFSQLVKGVLL